MSNETDKVKHSKRIYQKKNHVVRQTKIAKSHQIEVTEPHRLAKHSIMNCGRPKCHMCGNPRKILKERTIQEKRFYQYVEEV